jgi:hypothetical protein
MMNEQESKLYFKEDVDPFRTRCARQGTCGVRERYDDSRQVPHSLKLWSSRRNAENENGSLDEGEK